MDLFWQKSLQTTAESLLIQSANLALELRVQLGLAKRLGEDSDGVEGLETELEEGGELMGEQGCNASEPWPLGVADGACESEQSSGGVLEGVLELTGDGGSEREGTEASEVVESSEDGVSEDSEGGAVHEGQPGEWGRRRRLGAACIRSAPLRLSQTGQEPGRSNVVGEARGGGPQSSGELRQSGSFE